MQTKISVFFKPQNPSTKILNQYEPQLMVHQNSDANDVQSNDTSEFSLSATHKNTTGGNRTESTSKISKHGMGRFKNNSVSSKILKNKRSYAQLHLDFGQSDFVLHTCSTCGFKFACGDEADEKLHKELHKEYTIGIQFKGWENERVVSMSSTEAGRIILVLDGDPPTHKKKVEKVLQMMEIDLGTSGSLIHKLCKVYLYVAQKRIAGCLIAEPISEAHRVLSKSETPRCLDNAVAKKSRPDSSVLQFGHINLQREAKKKPCARVKLEVSTEDFMGAIILEKEAVPAICGIRAIWVALAMRRQHIATQLLDAARMSFSEGIVLDTSQLAFSDPTSTGKALAVQYCGTPSFLAYRADS